MFQLALAGLILFGGCAFAQDDYKCLIQDLYARQVDCHATEYYPNDDSPTRQIDLNRLNWVADRYQQVTGRSINIGSIIMKNFEQKLGGTGEYEALSILREVCADYLKGT